MGGWVRKYWQGKTVLLTGASSGLGWAVVESLAPYGIRFGLLSRREEKMKELAERLKESGSHFWYRACDVRDREAVYAAVHAFHKWAGRIDVAWVNSGISRDSSFERWTWEKFEAQIDTNLKGAIYTTMACLEIMVPQQAGTVVGIGSTASMRGMPTRGVYSLTKIGLAYFWESLAAELPQLQFTIIHPGFVDTPINQKNPNRFWLLQPQHAARLMIRAVARRKPVYIYPFRMNILYRCFRILPYRAYIWVARRFIEYSRPQPRKTESVSIQK